MDEKINDKAIDTLMDSVIVDQILIRALLTVVAKYHPEPSEMVKTLHEVIDCYNLPGVDPDMMEVAREKARMNVDVLGRTL